MKRHGANPRIVAFCVVVLIATLLGIELIQNSVPSKESKVKTPVAEIVSVPPAPKPVPSTRRKTAASSTIHSQSSAAGAAPVFLYDENLAFVGNLSRLKEFCQSHSGDQRFEETLIPFLKTLLARAKAQFAVVSNALEDSNGSAAYRNILLACLMEADSAPSQKANMVWRIALDSREPIEVRRTASFLIGQTGDSQKRPVDLYALLKDSDGQVVVFALEGAAQHLDQRTYDIIRTNLIHSADIHIQIAAVQALGNAHFADTQSVLIGLLNDIQTSKSNVFSEPSLLKRSALAYVDIHEPDVLSLLKRIALDDQEDPGVRAKAIGRMSPKEYPELANFLNELLGKLDSENSLGMRAAVDALLVADSSPTNTEAVRQKVNQISNLEIRDALLARVDIITKRKYP